MFFRSIIDFFKKKYFFSQDIVMEILSLEEENIIKDTRNLFRLEEELKQFNTEFLDILRIILSMKRNKIIINQ